MRSGSGSSARLPGRLPLALSEHAGIIAAIAAGDSRAAEEATRTHVRLAGEAFDHYLGGPKSGTTRGGERAGTYRRPL